ncbi:MAG TPA: response regulator transcription factor [Bacteroidota bacterium]|nr:response regulator transcription factor [Bacteroidota bacterium]
MKKETEEQAIRVMIVDDDAEIRNGLCWVIDHSPGFTCVGAFGRFDDALPAVEDGAPDVVLMDIGMPEKDGIVSVEILKQKYPDIQCLMLTVHSDDEKIFQSLRVGAVGYLLKKTPPDALLDAIRDARAGGAPMSTEVARKVLGYFQQQKNDKLSSSLSKRELEVLQALIDGYTYKAIADKLFVSTNTISFHLRNIYAKMHVRSRAEAVAKAIKSGLIP